LYPHLMQAMGSGGTPTRYPRFATATVPVAMTKYTTQATRKIGFIVRNDPAIALTPYPVGRKPEVTRNNRMASTVPPRATRYLGCTADRVTTSNGNAMLMTKNTA